MSAERSRRCMELAFWTQLSYNNLSFWGSLEQYGLNTSATLMFAASFSSVCNNKQFFLDLVLPLLKSENVLVRNFLDLLAASLFVSWPFCFFLLSKVYFLTFVMYIFHVLCHFLLCFRSLKCLGFPQVCLSLKWAHFLHAAINCTCVINSFTLATCAT